MSLSTIAYQIATDPDFEAQIRQDPEQALSDRGIVLSDLEMNIIRDMQQSNHERLLVPGDDPITQYEWAATNLHSSSN